MSNTRWKCAMRTRRRGMEIQYANPQHPYQTSQQQRMALKHRCTSKANPQRLRRACRHQMMSWRMKARSAKSCSPRQTRRYQLAPHNRRTRQARIRWPEHTRLRLQRPALTPQNETSSTYGSVCPRPAKFGSRSAAQSRSLLPKRTCERARRLSAPLSSHLSHWNDMSCEEGHRLPLYTSSVSCYQSPGLIFVTVNAVRVPVVFCNAMVH